MARRLFDQLQIWSVLRKFKELDIPDYSQFRSATTSVISVIGQSQMVLGWRVWGVLVTTPNVDCRQASFIWGDCPCARSFEYFNFNVSATRIFHL